MAGRLYRLGLITGYELDKIGFMDDGTGIGIVGILVGGGLVCGVSLGANSRCSHLSRLTKEEIVASIGLDGSGKVEHCTIKHIKTKVNVNRNNNDKR